MEDIKEQIKSKLDIVDLIGRYTNIKKAGSNYKGNCPFHNENTPSFMVSPSLQIFKCFGCGKAGDIFTFIMEMEGIEFTQALERLGEMAGVDTSSIKKPSSKTNLNHKYIEANELAKKFFNYTLLELSVGLKALKYLSNRGITKKQIKEFSLGYAPNSWNSLNSFMLKRGYKYEFLENVGLVKKGTNFYDTFRGRIIFPLINERGECVGFAGRTIYNEEPKYLNTKNTPLFNKSSFLYNLNNSKVEIKKLGYAVVVEGLMDALSPYIKGIKNIVATQGTSLTEGQVKLLKRYASEAVLFFDSDAAGLEAAVRGIEVAQNNGLNIKIAELPSGFKDPDEASQKSIDILHKAIDQAMPAYDYYFYYIEKKFDYKDALEKPKIVSFLKPKINKLTDPVLKAHYIKKLSELIEIPENSLEISTSQDIIKKEQQSISHKEDVDILFVYLYRCNTLILKKYYKEILEYKLLEKPLLETLKSYYKIVVKEKTPKEEYVTKNKDNQMLISASLKDINQYEENVELQDKTLKSLINQRKQAKIRQELKNLSEQIKTAERLHDAKKLDKLQEQFNILAKQLEKPK